MYFLDAIDGEPDARERLDLQQRLANRGDQAVLAVVHPGDLTLYPLHLDRKHLSQHGLGQVMHGRKAAARHRNHALPFVA